ncbi:pseudouridine synthase family protein isoform X1 [Carex rostrata]
MEIVWQTPANPPEPHDYVFRNGKRYVRPYYFEFISHVKNRWAGKTIVDLFSEEFKGRPYNYYVSAVNCGRLQVDGEMVHAGYVLQRSQKISHFLHRHEPPVFAEAVQILQDETDVLTVCKPASVPVHPCGQYRKNTVVGILQAENGLAPVFPVHRLDRLVSGLLIFAKNAERAEKFRQEIEAGLIKKEYIAKVVGTFPEGEKIVDANVNYNAREGRSTVEVCDGSSKPIEGKTACTKFERIATDGKHSIVLCKPVTGRTHQIRVHLQYTGHPIANDAFYLTKDVPPRSSKRKAKEMDAPSPDESLPLDSSRNGDDEALTDEEFEFALDPMCTNCPNLAPIGYDEDEEGLWLHCVCYTGPDWSYKCPYPSWATLA